MSAARSQQPRASGGEVNVAAAGLGLPACSRMHHPAGNQSPEKPPLTPTDTAAAAFPSPQAPRPALDQLVQSALQDLLSVAGLEHEDSWEAAAPAPLPQPPRASGSGQPAAATAGSAPATARRPSVHLGASGPSAASELAAVYASEEPLQSAAAFEEEEAGLPPAAALRLYQAWLRAAQADLAGLQAAVKAKEAKLGGLEKEVQQLRQDKAAWQKQQKALEAAAERSKRAADEARARAAEQEAAVKQIEAERRAGQQERRQAEAEGKAREAKLAAALEEATRLRKLLEEAKSQASARSTVSWEEHGRVVADHRQLAAQKQELLVVLKKAGRLIDVLRRQKVHLEAAALLQVSSRELADALQGGR
ncbi:testis-expressed sequence 9 isoform X2 [Chlorella sorokiniana]|uniref:Testis-expressed sequence 9 isoform X2 n=1 Tax=Chlorella sorokiniana TaxID=3076 RepID=A0A2P6TPY1_CHLSO|nr:testis-expressed sequence 9 isoform X2 [Chlorella sorokiniana]|eukprot:PRW56069.1 testis-expressed sequence 9 isoform X2 [Chlorella sorokiniana]